MNNPLIMLGASVRAAAYSAARGGFSPWCVDHFADADLELAFPVRRAVRYPHDLAELLHDAPPAPWMYTGALENHPEIITRIAAKRPLWGNDAEILHALRDPLKLSDVLRRSGFAAPRIAPSPEGVPVDGSWLAKRRRSAGGFHVRRWDGAASHERPEPHYFQEFVEGIPCSAVFVAAAGAAVLLGATRQLIGERWAGATGFQYVGSIGPLALEARELSRLRQLGVVLSREFGLRGLFGVDFVLNREGIWPIEVNPRYTASVEIVERAAGVQAIQWHALACRDETLPTSPPQLPSNNGRRHGKAIFFAEAPVTVTQGQCARMLELNLGLEWPVIADLPAPGSNIVAGAPVATVFAAGADDDEVLAGLRERVASQRRLLFPDCAAGIE